MLVNKKISKFTGTYKQEMSRYVINGACVSLAHYIALVICINLIDIAGIANLMASVVGIICSFFGCRLYVFKQKRDILSQFSKFISLYTIIALLHGSVMFLWTDVGKFDFRIGFLIATSIQMVITFAGNKTLVFK